MDFKCWSPLWGFLPHFNPWTLRSNTSRSKDFRTIEKGSWTHALIFIFCTWHMEGLLKALGTHLAAMNVTQPMSRSVGRKVHVVFFFWNSSFLMTLTLRCQHRREDKTRPESKTNPRSMEDDVILNHFPGMSLGQKGESGQSGITTTKGRMLLAYKGLKMIYKSENDDTGILLEGISSSRSWAGLKVSSPGQLTLRNGLTWLIFCGGQSGNGYYIFWAGYFETRSKHSKGTCGHSDHCNQSDSCVLLTFIMFILIWLLV